MFMGTLKVYLEKKSLKRRAYTARETGFGDRLAVHVTFKLSTTAKIQASKTE